MGIRFAARSFGPKAPTNAVCSSAFNAGTACRISLKPAPSGAPHQRLFIACSKSCGPSSWTQPFTNVRVVSYLNTPTSSAAKETAKKSFETWFHNWIAPGSSGWTAIYSGLGTAHGEIAAPLLDKLEIIAKSPVQGHVIVIDDVSDFCLRDKNAPLSKIVAILERIKPDYKFYFDYDMMFALPSETEGREFWRKMAYPVVIR